MKLLALVERITPRVEYIFGHMLEALFHASFELTADPVEFEANGGPKFSYGVVVNKGLYFGAVGLLMEEGIHTLVYAQ